jgi:hypothetical protein
LAFKGGDYVCIYTTASGALNSIYANLLFTSTNPAATSVDFVTVIKYSSEVEGECIQIGKFNYLGGNGERCSHYYDWPTEWNTGATSGTTYTATVDVSSAGYNYAQGDYTICFGDGNLASTYVTYTGIISYSDLVTEPTNIVSVSSDYGEPLEVTYDLVFQGGDYTCLTTAASGVINSITANLLFLTTDPTQTSVDFVTVIKYTSAGTADCIQIGQFKYLGGNGERCSHYYDWPTEWNTGATSGTTYTATVDVSSAGYNYAQGDYTICFGDGNL